MKIGVSFRVRWGMVMIALSCALGCSGRVSRSDAPSPGLSDGGTSALAGEAGDEPFAGGAGLGGASALGGASTGGAGGGGAGLSLKSLLLTPMQTSLLVGSRAPLRLIGVYSDGSTADVSGQAHSSSSAPSVATVRDGVIVALSPGSTIISAELDGLHAKTTVEVEADDPIATLEISPVASVETFQDVSFLAFANMKDGSRENVTDSVTWDSTEPSILSFVDHGEAFCLSAGLSTLSAKLGRASATLSVEVKGRKNVGYVLLPNGYVRVGDTEDLVLQSFYEDEMQGAVVSSPTPRFVTFESSNPAVLQVNGEKAYIAGEGSAEISAKIAGFTLARSTVVASRQAIVALAISPAQLDMEYAKAGKLTVFGTLSDGSQVDATRLVAWTFDRVYVDAGRVTAFSLGKDQVTASLGDLTASAEVNVQIGTPDQILIGEDAVEIPNGYGKFVGATAHFKFARDVDISEQVSWTSSNPAIASFGGPRSSWLVGHKPGEATYYVTLNGQNSNRNGVSVTSAVLKAFVITTSKDESPVQTFVGEPIAGNAYGTFDDGSELDLSLMADWSVGDAKILQLGAPPINWQADIVALSKGSTTLTATVGSFSAKETFVVGD